MASSAFDAFNLQRSMAGPDRPTWDVKDKQFIEITDTNNLNYSGGNINFDCNGFVSNVAMTDWQSSYLTIPITLKQTLTNPTGAGANMRFHPSHYLNRFAAQLKSGFFQVINGMTCTVANQTVVSLQQMSNIPMYFKILSSWNENDQQVYGPTLGFWKDTAGSVKYVPGLGECNVEMDLELKRTIQKPYPCNIGAVERHLYTISPIMPDDITQLSGEAATVLNWRNEVDFNNNRKNSYQRISDTEIRYEIFCHIPMPVLHDLFAKMPLQRGALWQLTLHTHMNPSKHTLKFYRPAATAGDEIVVVNSSTQSNNGFCPFQCAIPLVLDAVDTEPNGSTFLSDALGVTKTYDLVTELSIGNGSLKSCVMSVCQVELAPDKLSTYMADNVKSIVFEDFITCAPSQLQKIEPGQNGRSQVNAGLAKLRWMLIVPNLPAESNNPGGSLSAWNSPYSTGGATTAPWSFMDQLNVSLGSRNIWDRHSRYTYDQFVRNVHGINATNGNALPGLRSGLVNEMEWRNSYGYVLINLERHLESADALPASIDIEFVNTSTKTMAYTIYVGFEKEFALDCITGKIII